MRFVDVVAEFLFSTHRPRKIIPIGDARVQCTSQSCTSVLHQLVHIVHMGQGCTVSRAADSCNAHAESNRMAC